MSRYMIESKHSAEDCNMVIGQTYAMGYLHHFDWGCKVGVHCAWAILEAETEKEALMSVPSVVRDQARAVLLVKFSEDEARRIHAAQTENDPS